MLESTIYAICTQSDMSIVTTWVVHAERDICFDLFGTQDGSACGKMNAEGPRPLASFFKASTLAILGKDGLVQHLVLLVRTEAALVPI